jgi:hypothetical protein
MVFVFACKPGSAPAPTVAGTPATIVLSAPWGSSTGQLGQNLQQEGAAEGPASFAVDSSSQVHLLDMVNNRIVVFSSGKFVRQVQLPGSRWDDFDIAGTGYVLLDRFVQQSLVVVDSSGNTQATMNLGDVGIDEPSLVTTVSANSGGLWVEVEWQMRTTTF